MTPDMVTVTPAAVAEPPPAVGIQVPVVPAYEGMDNANCANTKATIAAKCAIRPRPDLI